MNNKRHHLFLLDALCILILCTAIYMPSLRGDFVYDDFGTIVKNPYIKNLKYIPDYFSPHNKQTWSYYREQHNLYRPILLLSFAFNYHTSRLDTFSYHITNLIIHIINTLLVYIIIRNTAHLLGRFSVESLQNNRIVALIAALLFGIHPIQTETVSYVISRSSLLSTFFIICSLIFFIQSIKDDKNRKFLSRIISLICFVLGLMTKEIALVTPFLLLTFSALYFQTLRGKNAIYSLTKINSPFFIILIIYLLARISLFGKGKVSSMIDIFIPHLFTALKAFFIFIRLLIFPAGQTVDHDLSMITSMWEPAALLSLLCFFVLIWFLVFKILPCSRVLFFWAMWFIIAFMPSLVIPHEETISEHTAYFPSVGFFAVISISIMPLLDHYILKKKAFKLLSFGLLFLLLLQLCILTLNRNLVWRNNLTLWSDAVKKTPNKARPHHNLGIAYFNAGRPELAIKEFQTVLTLDPGSNGALNNLGIIWAKLGQYEKAIKAFKDSIASKSFNTDAFNNLGTIYNSQGRFEEAISYLKESLSMEPNNALAYANLGYALIKLNSLDEGCYYLKLAIKLDPDYQQGVVYFKKYCAKINRSPDKSE